jgi:intracellular septation protein
MRRRILTHSQRLVLDLAPLAIFFLSYRFAGLMAATLAIILVSLVSLIITYLFERRVAPAPLISALLITIFGGLTLALDDALFIKMKPTILNTLFALVLLVGAYGFGRGLLKPLLEMALNLNDEGWRILSRRWGFFFLFLAFLNEVIWRNFSTDFWVSFKVFGMFTITLVFAVCQYRLVKQFAVQENTEAGQR